MNEAWGRLPLAQQFYSIMTNNWTPDELAYMVLVQQQVIQDQVDTMWYPGWDTDDG